MLSTTRISSLAILLSRVATAYLVPPPGVAPPGTASGCSAWVIAGPGVTCAEVLQVYGLSQTNFELWNPTTIPNGTTCSLLEGFDYCVQVDYISSSMGATSTSTSTTSTLSTSTTDTTSAPSTTSISTTFSSSITETSVRTPSPVQTGISSSCNKFYKVKSGDTCSSVASAAAIPVASLYAWNPAVGTSCSSLDIGDYVCIDIIGRTTTSGGVSTPSPIQTGMVSNCDKFHLVQSGDNCAEIAFTAGVSLTDFYSWNPAVGTSCASLGLSDYVCVDVSGVTPTATA